MLTRDKNLYLSKQYGVGRLLSEFSDKGRELENIGSLLKGIRRTTKVVWQPGSGRPRLSRSSAVEDLRSLVMVGATCYGAL